jgi:hypothetical protein
MQSLFVGFHCGLRRTAATPPRLPVLSLKLSGTSSPAGYSDPAEVSRRFRGHGEAKPGSRTESTRVSKSARQQNIVPNGWNEIPIVAKRGIGSKRVSNLLLWRLCLLHLFQLFLHDHDLLFLGELGKEELNLEPHAPWRST